MIYRYSVPTVPIYLQAVCGRGLADGERPQTDPWVWQVVEYSAADAVLGIDFPFRNELGDDGHGLEDRAASPAKPAFFGI